MTQLERTHHIGQKWHARHAPAATASSSKRGRRLAAASTHPGLRELQMPPKMRALRRRSDPESHGSVERQTRVPAGSTAASSAPVTDALAAAPRLPWNGARGISQSEVGRRARTLPRASRGRPRECSSPSTGAAPQISTRAASSHAAAVRRQRRARASVRVTLVVGATLVFFVFDQGRCGGAHGDGQQAVQPQEAPVEVGLIVCVQRVRERPYERAESRPLRG